MLRGGEKNAHDNNGEPADRDLLCYTKYRGSASEARRAAISFTEGAGRHAAARYDLAHGAHNDMTTK
jgi:hypothetical protein